MIGLQPGHIIIIVLVALIFLAPSRLPLLVRGMKKMMSEFRDEISNKSKNHDPANIADADKISPQSKK